MQREPYPTDRPKRTQPDALGVAGVLIATARAYVAWARIGNVTYVEFVEHYALLRADIDFWLRIAEIESAA
jgi:hypothetical protein